MSGDQNCYLLRGTEANSLLVDPGEDTESILRTVEDSRTEVAAILGTHGHYDHIASVAVMKRTLGAPFWLHSKDRYLLKQANLFSLAFGDGREIEVPIVDEFLDGKKMLTFGSLVVRVIEVPGHTPGSVAFLCDHRLLSGDTLFASKPGRTDLPGGDAISLRTSLKKLAALPLEILLAPGHGPTATLGEALHAPSVRVVWQDPSVNKSSDSEAK